MNTDRTLLVTGASKGIGRAIADKALAEGCRVIGISREWPSNAGSGTAFTGISLDLSLTDDLPGKLKSLHLQHPEIDGIVCNAGIGRFGSLEEFSPAQIRELIDLNLTASILLAREVLPAFKKRNAGNLIFMGSEAAVSGGKKGAVYSATKFAVRGLAQSLREECAGSGVRVGIVNPGMVDTGFFDGMNFRPGKAPGDHLTPEDVADAVWLMLSARTGAVIDEINLSPQKKVIQFGKSPA